MVQVATAGAYAIDLVGGRRVKDCADPNESATLYVYTHTAGNTEREVRGQRPPLPRVPAPQAQPHVGRRPRSARPTCFSNGTVSRRLAAAVRVLA